MHDSGTISQFYSPFSSVARPSVYDLDEMLRKIEQLHAPVGQASIHFELMLFLYLFLHTVLQNFNIYRTNFYNYNFYLLFLTVIVLLKRVLLGYWKQVRWHSPSRLSSPQIYLNLIIIAVIVSNSVYLFFQLFLKHPFKNFLFLVYPFVLYVACYGLAWRGTKKKKHEGKSSKHSCYYGRDAEEATEWFVDRLKGVAYSSLECGYFAGFLPLKFLQHDYLYFDSVRCAIIVLYITLNSFVMLFAHLLCTSFHELYLHSQMLGCWRVCGATRRASPISDESEEESEGNGHAESDSDESTSKPHSKSTRDDERVGTWSREAGPYERGVVVRHRGKHYVAIAALNSAQPGLYLPWLIYVLFGRPERVHTILILAQSVVVLSQLCLLLNSSAWSTYAVMLGCSYGVLYYCIATRRANLPLASGLQPGEWLPRPLAAKLKPKPKPKPQ